MFKKIKQSQRCINRVQALVALKKLYLPYVMSNGDIFKKVVGVVNYYVLVNCYAFGPTGQYFVLIFRIPTVFDIIPLDLVRFRYFVNSHSFLCPA